MEGSESLANVAALSSGRSERWIAGVVAASLIAFSFAPGVGQELSSASIGAYASVLTLGQLAAALLLFLRARLVGDRHIAVLGAAYLYSTLVMTAHIFLFLDLGPRRASEMDITAWLWIGWRIGFPLAMIVYALHPGLKSGRIGWLEASIANACASSALVIGLAYSGVLPHPYQIPSNSYSTAGSIANGAAIALTLVALTLVLRLRPLTSLDTWLAVALAVLSARYLLVAFDARLLDPINSPDAIWLFSGLIAFLVVAVAFGVEYANFLKRAISLDRWAVKTRRDYQIAKALQGAFVPSLFQQVEGLSLRGVYRPARGTELGGDWYDAVQLRDGRVGLSIGDIAGRGIDASIAMVRLKESLRAFSSVRGITPAEVLSLATFAVDQRTLATALFAFYDPFTGLLEYSIAGHPPPALLRNGSASFLKGKTGVPIGVDSESTYNSESIVLEASDTLILYTNGLIETTRDLSAGQQRLLRILKETHRGDVEVLVDAMLDDIHRDDVALLQLAVLKIVAR